MLKVHLDVESSCQFGGIKAVVDAQKRYLRGIEFVQNKKDADVTVAHNITTEPVDVLHLHNFYFHDLPGKYTVVHGNMNRKMLDSLRHAKVVTVPSEFIAYPLRRDFKVHAKIIPHGIDSTLWKCGEKKQKYILWNKTRDTDVCDTSPINFLSAAGFQSVSTFGDRLKPMLQVTGVLPHEYMQELIEEAGVYLATTPESFGIGVLEALASGVPVLAYNWGNVPTIVRDGVEGVVVSPGDLQGLVLGVERIFDNYAELSKNARKRAEEYSWDVPMRMYEELYAEVAANAETKRTYSIVRLPTNPTELHRVTDDYIICVPEGDALSKSDISALLTKLDAGYDIVLPELQSKVNAEALLDILSSGKGLPPSAFNRRILANTTPFSSLQGLYSNVLQYGTTVGSVELKKRDHILDITKENMDWIPWALDRMYPIGFMSEDPVMLCSYTNPEVTVYIKTSDICDAVIMTMRSLAVQRVPIAVVLDTGCDVGMYSEMLDAPSAKSRYEMHLIAGDVLHPTALLELLDVIADFAYVCTDSRKHVGAARKVQNGRKLLEQPVGTGWIYYPEVCWYTEESMPCGSCGGNAVRKARTGKTRTMRCIKTGVTTYIGKRKYAALHGSEVQVSPEDVEMLLRTGVWEEVKSTYPTHEEPKVMLT